MALSKKYNLNAGKAGITLLELALSMMVMAVLGVAVSSLVKAGADHNLSERQHQTMQMVAMNLVDDLRFDLRTAERISSLGSGSNSLVIQNTGQTITYALDPSTFQMSRTVSGGIRKVYNDPTGVLSNVQIQCTPSCFQPSTVQASDGTPKSITIPLLTVSVPPRAGSAGTPIDQYFGAPQFVLKAFTFNIATATEFQ